MARALLKPLPVFDQLCYWRQLVWSCVLTRTAAMLRRWPLYGLPSEVLVAHEMPACDENTLFFCFPDEFGHLKQGIVLAKRALQRGYRVDFMCPERARGKLPEGVRWIPMAGSVQRNTDLRVPLITTAARRDEERMEMLAYVLTDAPTKRDNWATYLSGATYLQHRAAQYRCVVLEHVFCAREYAHLALQQNTPVLSLDVTGFAVRPHYADAEASPQTRGWLERLVVGWLEAAAHPLLGWRRWLGGKCRQRQDAAWAQAVRDARLSTAAPRRRPPTEMISLHTQPEALLPPNLAQHTPRQHSVGPMLDPPSGDAEHAALKWIDAAARPVVYVAFGSQLTISSKDFRLVERLAEAVAASADFCFVWAVPAAAWDSIHPRVAGLGHVHLATWAPQLAILQHPKVKLFVSHGGGNSVGEALASACPLVVVPLNTDQYYWAERVASLGIGVQLDKMSATAQDFTRAFARVAGGADFGRTASQLSTGVGKAHAAEDRAIAFIEGLDQGLDASPVEDS